MSTISETRTNPSSAVRERRLVRAAARGDRGAHERLAAEYLPTVRSIAHRYRDLGLPLDDLVQEGSLGLIDAIERFDRGRSDDFGVYARWRIRRAILNALTEQGRLVRLPKRIVEYRRALAHLDEEAMKTNGHAASAEDLAAATGLSIAAVSDARGVPFATVSIDRPASIDGGDGTTLGSMLPDLGACDPEHEAVEHETALLVDGAVERLPARQRDVVSRHFGIGGSPESLVAIGNELHISAQRARAIERSAFSRLADELAPLLGDPPL